MATTGHILTVEQGSIYFFYRPRIGESAPKSEKDIQRFYLVLSPDGKSRYRLLVVGQKELPKPAESGRRKYWGYVSAVSDTPEVIRDALGPEEYRTKTRGERSVGPARAAGEGVYRIMTHGNHTHLAYLLELPEHRGEVQEELNIEEQASYVITVKNPESGTPPGYPRARAEGFPEGLQNRFHGHKFSQVNPPEYLDQEGAEFILIAASENVKDELGSLPPTEHETESSADIFTDLKLDRMQHPVRPLFQGEWE